MLQKKSIDLSPVHKKVLDEMEVLSDAFISTFSQIGKIVSGFSEEINGTLQRFLSQNISWRKLDSECYGLSYKPFTDFHQTEKFSIESLTQTFSIDGQISVSKMSTETKKRQIDSFHLNWGFYFSKIDFPGTYFYFFIKRDAKKIAAVLSLNDYNNLIEEFNLGDYLFEQEHPENRDPNEFIEFHINIKQIDKLPGLFDIFNKELFQMFLTKLSPEY